MVEERKLLALLLLVIALTKYSTNIRGVIFKPLLSISTLAFHMATYYIPT